MTNETPPPARRTTKLYKDPIDKKIGGVASGVAKYLDLDTTLVRAVWAVAVLFGGFGFLLYLLLWFILDDDPDAFAEPIEPRPVEAVEVAEAPVEADTALEVDAAAEVAHEEIETETVEADFEDSQPES